ncbi:MAG: M28 family peptidase [Duncaniella sp.]|nr:M28 family peptidase [Duncaniella sp.]MDE5734350.1 M28 family peptidase [Duncaniella sp.]MDE6390521.1 M28 family peptidase [Duncaniella sp.]
MKNIFKYIVVASLGAVGLMACGSSRGQSDDQSEASADSLGSSVLIFDADSAYAYMERQVAFGPRVAGTAAGRRCAGYLASELARHGADTVIVQEGTVVPFTGTPIGIQNIMGRFNPGAPDRILLVAHYDTRPWADADDTEEYRALPIDGANDGASGVGVLLEVARAIGREPEALPVGVDILFVDAEDYGQASGFSSHEESWALGTQYWTAHMPYAPDGLPRYAVLLDMVGGMDAKFHREYFSNQSAPQIVDKVWGVASRSGYGERFLNVDGGAVIDDHVFINRAGIPAIDIIETKNDVTKSFNPTWHTMNDNMDHIDKTTLKAVGQTVLNTLTAEKPVR